MDETHVRLVLEVLPEERGGGNSTRLRRWDHSVDYGDITVQDLPFILEALFPDTDPQPLVTDTGPSGAA